MKKLVRVNFLLLSVSITLNAFANRFEKGAQSWSGQNLIAAGQEYLLVVPRNAAVWIEDPSNKDFDGIDRKDLKSSMVESLKNTGKTLVLLGVAKEINDVTNFASNPENPYNRYKDNPARLKQLQSDRLNDVKLYLQNLAIAAKKDDPKGESDVSWIAGLIHDIESANDKTANDEPSNTGLSVLGKAVDNINIYGIGIEIVNHFGVGALAAKALNKMLPSKLAARVAVKALDSLSYDRMGGLLYFIQDKKQTGKDKDSYYAASFSQQSLRAQLAIKTRGSGDGSTELGFSVRLSLLGSTKTLSDFQPGNLNYTYTNSLTIENDGMTGLGKAKGIVSKLTDAMDKTNTVTPYLKENVRFSAGRIDTRSYDSDSGMDPAQYQQLTQNVPGILIRFSVGKFSQTITQGTSNGWFEAAYTLSDKFVVGK